MTTSGRFSAAFQAGAKTAEDLKAAERLKIEQRRREDEEFDADRVRWLKEIGIPVVKEAAADLLSSGIIADFEVDDRNDRSQGTARAIRITFTKPNGKWIDDNRNKIAIMLSENGYLRIYRGGNQVFDLGDFRTVTQDAIAENLEILLMSLGKDGL